MCQYCYANQGNFDMCELRIGQVTAFRLHKVFSILHLIETSTEIQQTIFSYIGQLHHMKLPQIQHTHFIPIITYQMYNNLVFELCTYLNFTK